jgi:hypothetical protein
MLKRHASLDIHSGTDGNVLGVFVKCHDCGYYTFAPCTELAYRPIGYWIAWAQGAGCVETHPIIIGG